MKVRCYKKASPNYKDYGGRGITICDRWLESFENFALDMGLKPTSKHTIERENNDGNYEPSNCKWATRVEQGQNKRVYKTSKTGYSGITLTTAGTYQARSLYTNRVVLGCFETLEEAITAQKELKTQDDPRKGNTTGVKGVTMQDDKFLVRRVINGKRVYLGNTSTLEEAKELYLSGVKQKRNKREN